MSYRRRLRLVHQRYVKSISLGAATSINPSTDRSDPWDRLHSNRFRRLLGRRRTTLLLMLLRNNPTSWPSAAWSSLSSFSSCFSKLLFKLLSSGRQNESTKATTARGLPFCGTYCDEQHFVPIIARHQVSQASRKKGLLRFCLFSSRVRNFISFLLTFFVCCGRQAGLL